MNQSDNRPDPDKILEEISRQKNKTGKLKIYFGYAAGVGKTYAMLDDAQELYKSGVDVAVGYLEPHMRPDTIQLIEGLPIIPPKTIIYKNIELKEFDLENALLKKPQLILVDELAHSNPEGMRNKKRYQDIEELLNAGIDVFTTVNVQHIESLNNKISDITKITVYETVPDYIFDHADKVKLVDIEPDELLKRFRTGKIYLPERAETAMQNFFTIENLRLLREIAMRKAADRISHDNQNEKGITDKMASIKMLVCIGPSASSGKCIRWTARTAEAFHCPWIAVYVENIDKVLYDDEKKSLRANMDLAEKLGAEVVILNGHDIITAVAEYAKLLGITNVVIGKSRNKKTLKSLFEMDLEDKLISLLPNIEVHIIPGNLSRKSYKRPKKILWKNNFIFSWKDTIKTFCILTAITFICFGLRALNINEQNIIMLYILSVLIISRITMGYAYSIISSVLSVLIFNFFFTEPIFTFNTLDTGYPMTFIIMLFVAFMTSALTVRIKTQASLAIEREQRTEILYEINKKLLVTRGLNNIVNITNEYITKIFEHSVIFYTTDPEQGASGNFLRIQEDGNSSVLQSEYEKAVAHWVFVNQKCAGADTDTLMGAKGYYTPVISHGIVLGVIGLSCVNGNVSQNSRFFLRMIVSQVAMALERQFLSDEQRRILVDSEKEKMRSNLLRAISHDLRTPLTGILGASSAILENEKSFDKETRDKLLNNIKEDSQWLIRMVENLLSVTRINEGSMNVTKMPEAVEEIVAQAISRIRTRFPDRFITVRVPDELLIVPMDGTLISQVLINLLENAVKHSPDNTEIEINVKKSSNNAIFEVIDNGKGIAEEDFPYLFEYYVESGKKSSDFTRGMGIGLSICMSIIKAHNGNMEAVNKKTGGAVFRFSLPLEENKNEQ